MEGMMFRKILVPTDGSELSDKAMNAAIDIARRLGGSLVGLCVSEPYPYSPLSEGAIVGDAVGYENRSLEIAHQHLERMQASAKAANVPCEVVVKKSFDPYKEIVEVAKTSNCDSIVMASHGRKGLRGLMLGSETQKVLAHIDIPVLVCK
jgi:nucleotide-binding universal stress UspA family protein